MSKPGFKPQGVYLLAKVPDSYYASFKIELTDALKKAKRKEYIERGDKLEVVVTGDQCVFSQEGDLIAVNSRGFFDIEFDGFDEPFLMIRDSEVIGKFTD